MGSGIPRGAIWAGMISIVLGAFIVYSGIGITETGTELIGAGSIDPDIAHTFGGFWKIFGWLFTFFGLLLIIMGVGLLAVNEWIRRTSVFIYWAIAIMGFFGGIILGYFSFNESFPPLIIAVFAFAMALSLRSGSMKTAYEFYRQGGRVSTSTPGYRDVYESAREEKMEKKYARVTVREPVRGPPVEKKMWNCQRCGTGNLKTQRSCQKCGKSKAED